MPSMEELNNLDEITQNQKWGIDKKIPIALIGVVIFQTVAITWGAATLSNDVKNYGERIIKIEYNLEKFIDKSEDKFVTKVNHDLDKIADRREIDEIKGEIDQLERRIRDVEKNLK